VGRAQYYAEQARAKIEEVATPAMACHQRCRTSRRREKARTRWHGNYWTRARRETTQADF
jgi:hypothetical protein